MSRSELLALLAFLIANFVAAAMGALFRPGAWYGQLKKPSWRPPDRVFALVWTTLYLMIAVSGWLVWRRHGLAGAAIALAIYALQLVLNMLWTPLFFGLHRPALAFLDIVLMWLAILATIVAFYSLHAIAAWLLVPYLAWVTFAVVLNFEIWRRNRARAGDVNA